MNVSLTRRKLLGLGVAGLSSLFLGRWGSPSSSGVTLIGAGDIACGESSGAWETAKLIEGIPGTVFANGDLAYESGTAQEFQNYYGSSWGRFKNRTRPAIGNHDYGQGGYEDRDPSLYDPSVYFDYFGTVAGERGKGWYSYELGDWHIVVLNSMGELAGGCGEESPQIQWLRSDLASNTKRCILAYWHHPVFSSGYHGSDNRMKPAWDILYEHGASVIINGHDHIYERFAPQDPDGDLDYRRGIRQFIVGTGGKSLQSPAVELLPNSEVAFSDAFGIIKFTLKPDSYDWQFIPVDETSSRDAGSSAITPLRSRAFSTW